MPLNRPALTLGSGPRSVHEARKWVVDTCTDIDRLELIECAELGVSELVTNALLHGEEPITVRVRGTREHPRVEVHDASTDAPILPSQMLEAEEHELLTFGRGLSIVARSADAWGAEVEDDGKVVWFNPAMSFADGEGVTGVITSSGPPREPRVPSKDRVRVEVLSVPLKLYIGFQHHFRELRREVRLLALAHEAEYPLAKSLSDLFGSMERELRDGLGVDQIQTALSGGLQSTDLTLELPRSTAQTLSRFVELLDLADEFCRQQRLLSLARTAEQRQFQNWFLTEFVRQSSGEQPIRWTDADANLDASVRS